MLGSEDNAVDATQTTFIQAYRKLKSFRGDCAFRTWLYRIASNACLEILRRERRRNLLSLYTEPKEESIPKNDTVWEAILELPPQLRVVLVLFYFQGLSNFEIAQALETSDGAVRIRLHRARLAFKEKYEEICNEM